MNINATNATTNFNDCRWYRPPSLPALMIVAPAANPAAVIKPKTSP